METVTCAFCGGEAPAASMDMTGNGWRCQQCTIRSEFATSQGKGAGMAEHLTESELREVMQSGSTEATLGGLFACGGVLGTIVSMAGGQIIIVFTGAIVGGLAMLGHGVHRRKQAKVALDAKPRARVVQR